jgi:alkanesulfonate monooxygenase SsuD/methylene tetrahydromethanopterin reductase-like flavin-dependent oxidoreductase (luciferase family)
VLIDVQVNPGRLGWTEVRELAAGAEAGGYSALWTFDHIAGMTLRGNSMLEAFTLLGALAVTTSTIELGTMVANVHNRTPALLAIAAATLEAIADRRIHIGLGAGSAPHTRWSREMRVIGQPVAPTLEARHARLCDTLDVLARMYDPDRPESLATYPLPKRRPTVLIGASSRRLAEIAGQRADGINVGWDHPHRDELLDAAATARGPRQGFLLTTWTTWAPHLLDPNDPERLAMAERGLDRLVLVVPAGVTPERLAQRP